MDLNKNIEIVLPNLEEKIISMWDLLKNSQKTLLFFYPKDNTPGCTNENKDFSLYKNEFNNLWIQLIWCSKDSIISHKKFIEKESLKNILISDIELELHKEFWAYGEKNNYWKIVMWVIRSTFLIDNKWNILNSWKWIKATWHAKRVLDELSQT